MDNNYLTPLTVTGKRSPRTRTLPPTITLNGNSNSKSHTLQSSYNDNNNNNNTHSQPLRHNSHPLPQQYTLEPPLTPYTPSPRPHFQPHPRSIDGEEQIPTTFWDIEHTEAYQRLRTRITTLTRELALERKRADELVKEHHQRYKELDERFAEVARDYAAERVSEGGRIAEMDAEVRKVVEENVGLRRRVGELEERLERYQGGVF
ncbi:hypothetical protein DFH27DRAFT_524252 [Peziza echinospora]|nr:hypothetical protein DFH27DRAFT_524252 [Peziza echinospora]